MMQELMFPDDFKTLISGGNTMNQIPKDPVMLLSYVNTQLRDNYSSLTEFCKATDTDAENIKSALAAIDYFYDESQNKFL